MLDKKELRRIKKIEKNGIAHKRSYVEKIIFEIAFAVFCIHAFTLIFPCLWMIMSSFKGPLEYAGGDVFALPIRWRFSNYIKAFTMLNYGNQTFVGMIFNSLWYTCLSTFMGLMMPTITGYVLSKYEFRGRQTIYSIAIICMILPIVGSGASHMKIIATLGLYDTPLYVIIGGLGGFGGSFIVYYGYFKSVSWSYAEAAEIDGAGPFTTFLIIMLPHAAPLLMVYGVQGAIAAWGEVNTFLLYLPSYVNLATGLFEYQSNAIRMANYPVYFAGLIISTIPTITLFAIFSGKIMQGVSLGGLKG